MDAGQGLRGMNWSASISQLVCIFLMTIMRAYVRRGLGISPDVKTVLDQHEMDWLALRVTREFEKDGNSQDEEHNGCDFWPTDWNELRQEEKEFRRCLQYHREVRRNSVYGEPDMPQLLSDHIESNRGSFGGESGSNFSTIPVGPTPAERLIWTVFTDKVNFANVWRSERDSSPAGKAQHALNVRQRLGQLTKWIGETSKLSVAVARSIGLVMDTFFGSDQAQPSFNWFLEVRTDDKPPEYIKFKVEHTAGKWKADATEIEAALSLWIFHIREMEAERKGKETAKSFKGNWLQRDVKLRRQISRVLGPDTADLRRDIVWWIGDGVVLPGSHDNRVRDVRGVPGGFSGPIGFLGSEPSMQGSGIYYPCRGPVYQGLGSIYLTESL
jgi:hypothetical protein